LLVLGARLARLGEGVVWMESLGLVGPAEVIASVAVDELEQAEAGVRPGSFS